MSPRFFIWLQSLAERDAAFVQLAAVSLAIVAAWIGIRFLPGRFQSWLRRIYLVAGLAGYVLIIILSVGGSNG